MNSLAYIGKINKVVDIEGADRIKAVEIVAGVGGIWKTVVGNRDAEMEKLMVIFLHDAIVDITKEPFKFLKSGRIRQCKFRGVPSECLAISVDEIWNPEDQEALGISIGSDVTQVLGITKYEKPLFTGHAVFESEGSFPAFLTKTDEANFQKVPEMCDYLRTQDCLATLKMDGTSCSVFKTKTDFGVCSRNLRVREGNDLYWEIVKKYDIEFWLPMGFGIQFEICGPGIQGNKMGLSEKTPFLFNVWDIAARVYIPMIDWPFRINMPIVDSIGTFKAYKHPDWQSYAETLMYGNGAPAEGMVIRPVKFDAYKHMDKEYRRTSVKVINLNYKD